MHLPGTEEKQRHAANVVITEVMHEPARAGDQENLEEIMKMRDQPLRLLCHGELQWHDHKAL